MEQEIKKPFYKRKWVWIVGILVILFIIGSTKDSSPSEVTNTSDTTKPTTENQAYTIGDNIKLGKSVITVNSIAFSQGGQFSKPQDGNEWINLNITIQNTDSSQLYVTTLGQMFVRDSNGNSYQVAVTDKVMENPNNSLDGTVIANSKRTGWVGFEIPKGATGLQFQYNGSLWGGGTIVVNLGR